MKQRRSEKGPENSGHFRIRTEESGRVLAILAVGTSGSGRGKDTAQAFQAGVSVPEPHLCLEAKTCPVLDDSLG